MLFSSFYTNKVFALQCSVLNTGWLLYEIAACIKKQTYIKTHNELNPDPNPPQPPSNAFIARVFENFGDKKIPGYETRDFNICFKNRKVISSGDQSFSKLQ